MEILFILTQQNKNTETARNLVLLDLIAAFATLEPLLFKGTTRHRGLQNAPLPPCFKALVRFGVCDEPYHL